MFLLLACCTSCESPGSLRQGLSGAVKPPLLMAKGKHLSGYDYQNPTNASYYLTLYKNAGTNQQTIRNEILNDLMGLIDYNYHEFETGLRQDAAIKNLAADIASLGLTAAATAAGGNEVKTILSAIATGVVGANTALDKDAFQNNTVQALELEMRSLRSGMEAKLNTGMKQSVTDYPLQAGLRDVVEYYYSGSLTDALMGLMLCSKTRQFGANEQGRGNAIKDQCRAGGHQRWSGIIQSVAAGDFDT